MTISSDRSRRLPRAFAAALLLLSVSSAVQAQDAADTQNASTGPTHDAIIIQGLKSRGIESVIGSYVRGLTVMNSSDPLARYEPASYCPAVIGLSEALDAEIAARMRQVAAAAGVKPAPPGCRTSALVFFVDDKAAFVKEFRRQQPAYFKDPKGDLWSPPSQPGPAISWQLTQELDPDGNPLQRDMQGVRYVQSSQGGSRMLSMVTIAVAMSVVIIERKALDGLSTTQIADYALMRSLTDRGPENLQDARRFSILGVIDAPMGSETPASLTRWDLAYIQGRYAGDPRFYGTKQGAIIRGTIERAVTGKQ